MRTTQKLEDPPFGWMMVVIYGDVLDLQPDDDVGGRDGSFLKTGMRVGDTAAFPVHRAAMPLLSPAATRNVPSLAGILAQPLPLVRNSLSPS